MHHRHDADHFQEVFRTPLISLQVCGCGLVHLGIGPVTVKLTRDAYAQAMEGLGEGARRLEALRKASPAEAPRPLVPQLGIIKGGIH